MIVYVGETEKVETERNTLYLYRGRLVVALEDESAHVDSDHRKTHGLAVVEVSMLW